MFLYNTKISEKKLYAKLLEATETLTDTEHCRGVMRCSGPNRFRWIGFD